MNFVCSAILATPTLWLAVATLDGNTRVPLGPVLGSAATVFLIGMWVSRKVTKFEEVARGLSEQQAINMSRLDSLDKHLLALDERLRIAEHKHR